MPSKTPKSAKTARPARAAKPRRTDHFFDGAISVNFEYPGMAGLVDAEGTPLNNCIIPYLKSGEPALYEELKKEGFPLTNENCRISVEFQHLAQVLHGFIFTLTADPRRVKHSLGQFDHITSALWGKTWRQMAHTLGTPVCPVELDAPDLLLDEVQALQNTLLAHARATGDLLSVPAMSPFVGRYVSFKVSETRRYSYSGTIRLTIPLKWKDAGSGVDAAMVRHLFTPSAPFLMRPDTSISAKVVTDHWYGLILGTGLSSESLAFLTYWNSEYSIELREWIAPHIAAAREDQRHRFCREFNPYMIDALAAELAKRFDLPLKPLERKPVNREHDLLRALSSMKDVLNNPPSDAVLSSTLAPTPRNVEIVLHVLEALRKCSPLSAE